MAPVQGFVTAQQPRTDGGQFTHKQHAEPLKLDLWDDEGTFEYPPSARSAEQVIAFWQKVSIPDAALANFRSGYEQMYRSWVLAASHEFQAANPIPTNEAKAAAWKQARDAHIADRMKGRPRRMPQSDVRPIFRATAIWLQSRHLPPEEQERARSARTTSPENGRTVSIGTMVDIWQSHRLEGVMHDPTASDLAQLRKLDQVSGHLQDVAINSSYLPQVAQATTETAAATLTAQGYDDFSDLVN
jgi:hypothetical protein